MAETPQEVARRAIARARQRGASPKVIKALIEAGIVESGLQHGKYSKVGSGDRDSVGFLQQRPSMGWGPAGESIEKDVDDFLKRAVPIKDKYGKAGALAQAVQRSAFPGKYDKVSAQAERYLRGAGGSGGGSVTSAPSSPADGTSVAPESDPSVVATLLQAAMQQQQPRSSMGVQAPAFSAAAAMPAGYQQVTSGGGPAPKQDINALLSAASQVQQGEVPQSEGPETPEQGAPQGTSAPASKGKGKLKELFYDPLGGWDEGKPIGAIGGHSDHVHAAFSSPSVAIRAGKLAQSMGLSVREQSAFDKVDPVHTKSSFHYSDRAIDVSGDPKKMAAYTRRLKQMYGIR